MVSTVDFTSTRVKPRGRRSSTSTAAKTPSLAKAASKMAGAPAASAAAVEASFSAYWKCSWSMSVPPGNSAWARFPTRWPRS